MLSEVVLIPNSVMVKLGLSSMCDEHDASPNITRALMTTRVTGDISLLREWRLTDSSNKK